MPLLIRVPATTANLGPGFDCLGLALDLWNEVEVETSEDGLQILVTGEGQKEISKDRSNAIYQAMQAYAQRHHKSLPKGIRLRCLNRIPIGAGLGSSAAAAVSGILAASALLKIPANLNDQLECATLIEGHPDNVAPCLLGGLVAAVAEDHQVIARNLPVAPLQLLLVVPDFHFPTRASRATLPPEYSRRDTVFNLGNLALLTHALADGDLDLISQVMLDRLHQPYRVPLIPGAAEAFSSGLNAGAVAVVLSGAGPSLLALLKNSKDRENVGQRMLGAFAKAGIGTRIYTPAISMTGAVIHSL